MSVPVWAALCFAAWTMVVLLLGVGVHRWTLIGVGVHRWTLILAGKAELKDFPGDQAHGPPLYRRATRAHANCIENLPVLAVIVLAAEAAGARSPVLDVLSVVAVAARVVQTTTHLISVSNTAIAIRFSFFSIQFVAFVWMGVLVVLKALAV